MNANACPFCIENNLLRVKVLYKDDLWYVTEMNEGSITNAAMAVTKRHIETPFEINDREWAALRELLPKMKSLLELNEAPDGYNVGWNIGEIGGQNVAHAHLHLIGRYKDEPLAGKGIRYAFKGDDNQRTSKRVD